MSNEENMKLWSEVCTTDPATTKHVAQRGGFTAICAQSQLKRATEMWGPYGFNWGVGDCNYGIIEDGGKVAEITLDAVFFYPGGKFEISGDIQFRPGNESRKKLLTDVTTKALSKLGFNSDVFEGKFDDNRYVQGLKENTYPASNPATDPFKKDAPVKRTKPSNERNELPADDSWINKPVGKKQSDKGKSFDEKFAELVEFDNVAVAGGLADFWHDIGRTEFTKDGVTKEYFRDDQNAALEYLSQAGKAHGWKDKMAGIWLKKGREWLDMKGLTSPA